MKTTKKGFTLIELIVVIAIIGVLAAILVPAMLGYVKKSKISAAESACSSIQKAVSSTLTDLEAAGFVIIDDGWIDFNGNYFANKKTTKLKVEQLTASSGDEMVGAELFKEGIKQYFKDITKVVDGAFYIDHGTCTAVCATIDGNYWGTWPSGVVTAKNSDDMSSFTNIQSKLAERADLTGAKSVATASTHMTAA